MAAPAAAGVGVRHRPGDCLVVPDDSTNPGTELQIAGCDGRSDQSWISSAAKTGTVTGYEGLCLDVQAANSGNGIPIQIYNCNGTAAQNWQPPANGELLNPGTGRYLDDDAFGGSGTTLFIYDCNDGANQQWKLP